MPADCRNELSYSLRLSCRAGISWVDDVSSAVKETVVMSAGSLPFGDDKILRRNSSLILLRINPEFE
jgi:hypothetical protein